MIPDSFDERSNTEINEEDYGFIVDAEGNLKQIYLPDVIPEKLPKSITKILKMFDIIDLAQLNNPTIH